MHGNQCVDRLFSNPQWFDRLIGPEILRLVTALRPVLAQRAAGLDLDAFGNRPFVFGFQDLGATLVIWPRCAGTDPLLDVIYLFGSELVILLGWHGFPLIFMRASDGDEQGAVIGPAGNDRRRAALSALDQGLAIAHVVAALELCRFLAMAGEALRLEKRLDPLNEQCVAIRRSHKHRGGGKNEAADECLGHEVTQACLLHKSR